MRKTGIRSGLCAFLNYIGMTTSVMRGGHRHSNPNRPHIMMNTLTKYDPRLEEDGTMEDAKGAAAAASGL